MSLIFSMNAIKSSMNINYFNMKPGYDKKS